MTITQMETFLKIAETRNFTTAAACWDTRSPP